MYHPANTSAAFFEDHTQLVECISAEAKETHFVGDFSIDLLLRNDSNSSRLKHLMENFGLHQMIDKPTRFAKKSKTLLDHHYCTHPEHVLCTAVPTVLCKSNANEFPGFLGLFDENSLETKFWRHFAAFS